MISTRETRRGAHQLGIAILSILGLVSFGCQSVHDASQGQAWSTKKPLQPVVTVQKASRGMLLRTAQPEDDLWRTYVINATDATVMGMVLDGKQQWLPAPFGRTCSKRPPDPCADDQSTWRMILIQGCQSPAESLALIYKDTDGQLYQTDPPARLVPNCNTGGAILIFRDP
jgi:hypothetical protein